MSKKARVSVLTITVVLTVCVFILMCLTRPGHSSYAKEVLDAAASRQSQSLISVQEPLETDTYVLSEEEKMAEKVSEILKGDEDFKSSISEPVQTSVYSDLDEWKKTLSEEIKSEVESYLASYSFEDILREDTATVLNSDYDEIVARVVASVNSQIDEKLAGVRTYTDESVSAVSNEMKAYVDGLVDVDTIALKVASSIGVADDQEYVDLLSRLVSSTINKAIEDPEVYDRVISLIENVHNSLVGTNVVPTVVNEVAPAIEEQNTTPETVVEEVKVPIAPPVFGEPIQQLSDDEYREVRNQRRAEQLQIIEDWLN